MRKYIYKIKVRFTPTSENYQRSKAYKDLIRFLLLGKEQQAFVRSGVGQSRRAVDFEASFPTEREANRMVALIERLPGETRSLN
jgi:hypothetical protein